MNTTIEVRLKNAIKKYGNDFARIAKNLRVTRGVVRDFYENKKLKSSLPNKISKPKVKVKTLTDFRSSHDFVGMLKDGIAKYLSDGYVTENELKTLLSEKIPVRFWRETADNDIFEKNKLRYQGKILWSNPNNIQQMKKIIGIIV